MAAASATNDEDPRALKAKQIAYHDWEAQTYDDKFSISYDQRCIDYAGARFRQVIDDPTLQGRVLEVGAGTGFFLINLALGGYVGGELHATDISEGMLAVCRRNAEEHGLTVTTRPGDVEALPYPDDSFDVVVGHAFLHHLPVPGQALQELHRVLRPGGHLLIAGEPTELGDRIAGVIKRATAGVVRGATAAGPLAKVRKPRLEEMAPEEAALAGLEHQVDLHTFRPRDVRSMATVAGFEDVEVVTEELVANWVGWVARTVEGSVREGVLGWRWAMTAYRSYLALSWLDERLLRRVVPDELFYNLVLHARKPLVAADASR